MGQFWKYETELQAAEGFSLWGPSHFFWLLFLGFAIVFVLQAAVKSTPGTRLLLRRISATAAFLFEVVPAAVIMAKGEYGLATLPLHICSLASCAVFAHMLISRSPLFLSEILFFPMLPGAVLALLFPDWTMYPAFSFFSCSGFLVHGAIALYILLCLFEGILKPDIHHSLMPILFLACYALLIIPFDHAFSVNYGFLNAASPGSPLVLLAEAFGPGPGYYISYALITLLVMVLWYGIWHILKRRTKN